MLRTCKQEVEKPAEFIKRTAAAKRRVWSRHRVLVSNLQLKRADAASEPQGLRAGTPASRLSRGGCFAKLSFGHSHCFLIGPRRESGACGNRFDGQMDRHVHRRAGRISAAPGS